MKVEKISYELTYSFSKFILNYISKDFNFDKFLIRKPNIENFEAQIIEKQKQNIQRDLLVDVLNNQYNDFTYSIKRENQIKSLLKKNTFTVATGHQLCLFTGPLYFIYKIISTLNLTKQLKFNYPEYNFVPIFWMASEDHDFQEVNHINLFGDKIIWEQNQKGAVGEIPTQSLEDVLSKLKNVLGTSDEAKELYNMFNSSYLIGKNMSDATRILVHKIFSNENLLVIDSADSRLKRQAIPIIKNDILLQSHHRMIKNYSENLIKTQAFVRPINFFYMKSGFRERIEKIGNSFKVVNTNICFSEAEIEAEIEKYPEHFSPNVLMLPIFKELILPNIAMVGGAAEVNYWMQLKSTFELYKLSFPILILRNSVLYINQSIANKIKGLGFKFSDLFSSEHDLHAKYIEANPSLKINLTDKYEKIINIFNEILNTTDDHGIQSSIKAEKQKIINSLIKLEKKLQKVEKKKHEISLNQISQIKKKLFPNQQLQERYDNMIPFYLKSRFQWIESLKKSLNPLEPFFTILIEE